MEKIIGTPLSLRAALLAILAFVLFPYAVFAASITLSPESGSYAAGSSFTVDVFVSSPDQAMNAVSGTISFPADQLSVVSLSKSNSIISLWTSEPTFSNAAGSISFEGIVLNPGFTGVNGKIISITFRALSPGNPVVSVDSGSVLANDGTGTSIPTTLGDGSFTITNAPSIKNIVPVASTSSATVPSAVSTPVAGTSSSTPIVSMCTNSFTIILFGFQINIFLALSIIFLLILLSALMMQRMLMKIGKTKSEMAQMVAVADKLANTKFTYYNDYVNAQLDLLEKDKRMKTLPGSVEVIEHVRKHIADFKDFIEKQKH